MGAAAHGLKDYEKAVNAYQSGLKLDPNNEQLKADLNAIKQELQKDSMLLVHFFYFFIIFILYGFNLVI